MRIIDNDLLSIQEARILAENARESQKELSAFNQEKLDKVIYKIIERIENQLYELAKESNLETGYGIVEHKFIKNKFICDQLKNRLKGMKCVGIIQEDRVMKTMDVGVPRGVILAFPPATSPVSTTIYNVLISIKSGNSIIISPNPKAKNTIFKILNLMIEIARENGLPENAISFLNNITRAGNLELINHKDISLIINTGVSNFLNDAYKSGKQVIYGGNGNGPAFIERTADIKKAVRDIIYSKTFDNGIVSATEQAIVVDKYIEEKVRKELEESGGYFLNEEEEDRIEKLFEEKDLNNDSTIIGKSAKELAKKSGIESNKEIKLLISKQKYVDINNKYNKERLCPIISYYIEEDWINACEKCIELLLTEKQGHTLVIHSKDEEVIKQFILRKPVGRILVNTPSSLGSMGLTTNLFPSMTLGSGSIGQGMTSDNVSPNNLIYIRKVGYGVRDISLDNDFKDDKDNYLEAILEKVLENLRKKI